MSKLKLSSNASGSGNVTLQSPNTNSDFTVTVPTGTGALPLMKLETAVASTSGTSIDFTGIPSWVKRITVLTTDVSLSGTSTVAFQLGTSGGVVTSGYNAGSINVSTSASNTTNGANSTTQFNTTIGGMTAASLTSGAITFVNISSNTWVASGMFYSSGAGRVHSSAGSVALGGTLDRVRITTVNGTDTFDAGSINIMYEG